MPELLIPSPGCERRWRKEGRYRMSEEMAAEDIRVGVVLRLGGQAWQVADFEWLHRDRGFPLRLHVRRPGGGGGTTFEVTHGQTLELVPLAVRPQVFLYRNGDCCVFVDPATGEEHELAAWACLWRNEPEAGSTVTGGFLNGRFVSAGEDEPRAGPGAAADPRI